MAFEASARLPSLLLLIGSSTFVVLTIVHAHLHLPSSPGRLGGRGNKRPGIYCLHMRQISPYSIIGVGIGGAEGAIAPPTICPIRQCDNKVKKL